MSEALECERLAVEHVDFLAEPSLHQEGEYVMKTWSFLLGPLFAFLVAPAAHAQVTVDYAKITCNQFLIDTVAPTKFITIWLNGYYNGKRGNTIVDVGAVEKNSDKVQDYCRLHQDVTVMQAVEATLGYSK